MKLKTKDTPIITAPASRTSCWLSLVACAAMLILTGCTADDTPPADGSSNTPVTFNARVQTTPATRTAIGADGQTIWADGDAVSVFMLTAGEAMPDGILTGADNVKYNVAASGALSPAGTPLYYPLTGKVDFIALYPYSDKETENGKITDEYKYPISVTNQSQPEAIDVLYAKASGREKSQNPVSLAFGHVLSKIKLDIKPGNGMTDLTADQITAVTLTGMPASATLALQDGTLTPGTTGDISALKEAKPSPGAIATFTALVPPQAAKSYTRSIIVTVNGEEFTGNIPATDAYASNEMCTYPVTVLKRDIDVGEPEIGTWGTNEHDTGTATELTVRIPAGTFMMGDTVIQHQVTLTKDFYMSKYEITSQQYAEFLNDIGMGEVEIGEPVSYEVEGYDKQALFEVNEGGWTPKWDKATNQWKGDNRKPMLYVSWYGAKAYADWIGGALPTEAQWEYACRAGTTTVYWFGDDAAELGEYAWYSNNSGYVPQLVGGKLPNPWGLYDMYGNAAEWCADWYDRDYYNSSPNIDPIGPASGEERMVRGGSYKWINANCRSAYRFYTSPTEVVSTIGFRIIFVP